MVLGRLTNSIDVAYLVTGPVDYNAPIKRLPLTHSLSWVIPMIISAATCVMCVLVVSSGLATFVIGRGRLMIKKPVRNSVTDPPPGILLREDSVGRRRRERDHESAFRIGRRPGDDFIAVSTTAMLPWALCVSFCSPPSPSSSFFSFLRGRYLVRPCSPSLSAYRRSTRRTSKLRRLGVRGWYRFCVGTRASMAVLVCLFLFHDVTFLCAKGPRSSKNPALMSSTRQCYSPIVEEMSSTGS